MNFNDVKQIRWADIGSSTWNHARFYGVTAALTLDPHTKTAAVVSRPVGADNWCKLTERGIRIANEMLNLPGISFVNISTYDVSVVKAETASWADLHETILFLLNDLLFEHEAQIYPLEERKTDWGLIRWSDSIYEPGRIYKVSTPLKSTTRHHDSRDMLCRPLEDRAQAAENNPYELTEAAITIVNTLFSLTGVSIIFIGTNTIHVQLAKVFDISDYHEQILAVLQEVLFSGRAWVEAGS